MTGQSGLTVQSLEESAEKHEKENVKTLVHHVKGKIVLRRIKQNLLTVTKMLVHVQVGGNVHYDYVQRLYMIQMGW